MEINAYMNGYKPETDNKFLTESLEAHKTALADSKLETETAKEFLYQHIKTNKELEKEVERYRQALINTYVDGMSIEEILNAADKWAALETEEDPSETHTATHPELYFEK